VTVAVSPKDSDLRVKLEYGRTTGYGSSTTAQLLSSAQSRATVTLLLSGLRPGAKYHVRAVAASAVGTAKGPDRSFRTAPAAR
jgi:hypothetical protein